MSHRPVWVFDDFELDVRAWRLSRAGRPLPVEPKGLALLALLIERQGEVVTKGEILDAIWRDATVTENAMVRVVAHVRALLGDGSKEPKYIETVHTRGYRFVGRATRTVVPEPAVEAPAAVPATRPEIETQPRHRRYGAIAGVVSLILIGAVYLYAVTARTAVSVPPASAPAAAHPSIAILPLENLGPDAQQYFADGMTEALTTQLARIEALKVISRGAVLRYRVNRPAPSTIARELGVGNLVEGSVLLAGDRVRITARLVDGVTDRTLWGDSYDGDLHDIVELQGRVARAIVREIRVRMSPEEETRLAAARTVDPAAYQEYLRGLYEYERSLATGRDMFSSLAEAIARFQAAVALEPAWGDAHGALAQAHQRLGSMSDDHAERLREYRASRAAAERALELDPTVVTARLALARSGFVLDGNWEAADHQYREVLRLEPNNAALDYAIFLTYAGRFDEAIARQRYALERSPASPTVRFWLGVNYICAGRYEEASAEAYEMRNRLGDDVQPALLEGMALAGVGLYADAVELLESRRAALLVNRATTFLQRLGHAAARAGDTARARRALRELQALGNPPSPSILFALGDVDAAVEQIETLNRRRDYSLLQSRCWPEYDNLRRIPAVRKILLGVGISDPD
jgi:TolB-like protein/DNA-binding winged helix-turn-helix (wHTH) protein/tetratricopeptide (TPR) repeat protein